MIYHAILKAGPNHQKTWTRGDTEYETTYPPALIQNNPPVYDSGKPKQISLSEEDIKHFLAYNLVVWTDYPSTEKKVAPPEPGKDYGDKSLPEIKETGSLSKTEPVSKDEFDKIERAKKVLAEKFTSPEAMAQVYSKQFTAQWLKSVGADKWPTNQQ